ncbi:hypothetical protein [Acuticoccus sp.]
MTMPGIFVMVIVSFTSSTVYTLPPPDWSLRWYEGLSRKSRLWDSVVL